MSIPQRWVAYTITYSATDSAGNTGSETREVNVVDTIAPVITLSGDSTIELLASENFTDPGATATDSFEGSLSVSTSGSVDNTAEGTYTLTYTASDSSGNSASETRTVNVLPSTVLTVQTQNYFTGDAIEGAPVSITATEDGDEITRTGITDSNGEISVAVADDAERIVVSSDAEGYGEYSAIVTTLDQTVDLFLQPVNAEISFTPTTESDLEVSGINVVSLAANSLVDENGNTPTGDVSAELTIIDPSVDPELMPGNFETLDTDTGEAGQIESFGAVSVTFEDEDGNSYNLNSGETATVRIPLASGTSSSSAPDTIPLYYFDEETGYWVEEGTATLVTNDGETYYEGTVSHFTTWNADYLYDSIQINGCVEDSNGDPISLAEIKTQGVSYSGQAWTTSDATGSFSVAAKPSSTVLLSATTPGGLSRTSTITTSSVDIDQSECIILDESAAVVTLTWGASPSDLDTHFFGPDSEDGEDAFHISYTNKEETINNSSIWLDVDDTSSYGPEITTISSFPYSGRYSYAVYKYSSSGSDIAESPARVELNYSGQRQVFSAPEGDATRCWAVFDFVVDEQGGVTIEETGSWESYSYCHAGEYSADDYSTQSNHQSVTEDNSGVLKDMILRKYYAK